MEIDDSKSTETSPKSEPFPNLGLGLFLVVAGVLYLAESLGWISKDLRWGLPVVAIIYGLTLLIRAFAKK